MMYTVKKSKTGLGLFATADIKKGTNIIEYTGKVLTTAQADEKGGRYLCEVNSRKTVDGSPRSNTARYINHSCKPNARMYTERGRLFVYAIKKILAGEEITYHYGKEYFSRLIEPRGCRCNECTSKVLIQIKAPGATRRAGGVRITPDASLSRAGAS